MNVLLYVVDCLRADHVHALGYERATTPNLDALIQGGAAFERFYAQGGWTAPSAASLLSGLLPSRTGIHCMRDLVRDDIAWLPETLQRAGWNTAAFTAMAQVSAPLGFARGFDTFVEAFSEPDVIRACRERGQDVRNPRFCLPLSSDLHTLALRWLDARADARPWFAFVWSIDTHEPFRHPARFDVDADPRYAGAIDGRGRPFSQVRDARDRQHVIDLYDGALRHQDEQLGALIDALRARGELDDTLIVVVGDHGEMFWEHGLAGHGKFPWEEELRVPCVVRWPSRVRAGTRVRELASNLDLAPTIAELCGVAFEPGDGASFAHALAGGRAPERDALLVEVPSPFDRRELARVVLHERWKFVHALPPTARRRWKRAARETARWLASWTRPATREFVYGNRYTRLGELLAYVRGAPRELLFDLASDPRERRDMLGEHSENAALLKTFLAVREPASSTPLDPESQRRLTAQLAELGYIEE